MKQWECSIDREGNIRVASGNVIAQGGTQIIRVQKWVSEPGAQAFLDYRSERRTFLGNRPEIFIGGNGRNLRVTTTGGTLVPQGYFKPTATAEFRGLLFPDFRVVLNGGGDAEVNDGTDVVATAAGPFTLVPEGTFTATTYGEDEYNGGSPFTLSTAWEGGAPIPNVDVPAIGTAPAQIFAAVSPGNWIGATDADWTLSIDDAGEASISYLTAVIAVRASGDLTDPSGLYLSTPTGAEDFNDEEPFELPVFLVPALPKAGYVFITIEVDTNPAVIVSVSQPRHAAALPENSGSTYYVPIAWTDGQGYLEQIQEGPIFWAPSTGGGVSIVEIGLADFEALDPPDPDTLYAITGP